MQSTSFPVVGSTCFGCSHEVFLQHVIGQGREERLQLKERRLLLDNAVDSYVADLETRDHRPNSEIGMLTRG